MVVDIRPLQGGDWDRYTEIVELFKQGAYEGSVLSERLVRKRDVDCKGKASSTAFRVEEAVAQATGIADAGGVVPIGSHT